MGWNSKAYPEMLNNLETIVTWTPAMLFNKFATREYLENRRILRLWQSAVNRARIRKIESKKRILVHRSKHHYMRTLSTKPHRRERYRIRNEQLFTVWADTVDMAQFRDRRKLMRQWRVPKSGVKRFLKTVEFLNKKNNKELILNWTRGIENLRRMQFVVVHRNQSEMIPPALDTDSQSHLEHFLSTDWYLAVVQFIPDPSRESEECLIRNMETFQLETHPRTQLICAENLPKFGVQFRRQMVRQRRGSVRDVFQRSLRFVMLHNTNDLDFQTLRSFLRVENKNLRIQNN